MYSFSEQDFANLRKSKVKVKIKAAFFVTSLDDVNYYATISETMSFSEVNIFITSASLKNFLTLIEKSFKETTVKIFCLITCIEHRCFELPHIHYFTTDLELYCAQEKINYYWPALDFTETRFFLQKKTDLSRKIQFVPFPAYNSDACQNTSFSAVGETLFETFCAATDLSIIIPHYDNSVNLMAMLKSLSAEISLSQYQIDVILVDDGSPEIDFEKTAKECSIQNFKILRLPRTINRQMGDVSYRAGVARNFGAEHAVSEKLLFLDCDMLIGHELIIEVIRSLGQYDLIMPRRYQLHASVTKKYDEINFTADVNLEGTPYWTNFYNQTNDWDLAKYKWKYVSTYCLAITKNNFYKLGPFSASFVSYGCEDVDLGFKAYKDNLKFHLAHQNIYHLQPQTSRSEYEFDVAKKEKLSLRAFYYLYQVHLDHEIFDALIFGKIELRNSNRKTNGN